MAKDPDGFDRDAERKAQRERYDAMIEALQPQAEDGSKKAQNLIAQIRRRQEKLGPDDGVPLDLDALTPSGRDLMLQIRGGRAGRTLEPPTDLDDLDRPS